MNMLIIHPQSSRQGGVCAVYSYNIILIDMLEHDVKWSMLIIPFQFSFHTDVIPLFDVSQPLVVATHASLSQLVRLYHTTPNQKYQVRGYYGFVLRHLFRVKLHAQCQIGML